jgi:hypothetical protein
VIVAGIVWALAGILVIVATEMPARGRLGINGMVGMRFGPLLMSDRAWVAGHRAAVQSSWAAGISMMILGLVIVFGSLTDEQGALAFGIGFAVLVICLVIASRRAYVAASAELGLEQDEMDP